MTEIFSPPLLARGSFHPGTGVGCIMNLMCWTKHMRPGEVNDEPAEFEEGLRGLLISLNDHMCSTLQPYEFSDAVITKFDTMTSASLNCVNCSALLLDWAFLFSTSQELYKLITHKEVDRWYKLLGDAHQRVAALLTISCHGFSVSGPRPTWDQHLQIEFHRKSLLKIMAEFVDFYRHLTAKYLIHPPVEELRAELPAVLSEYHITHV